MFHDLRFACRQLLKSPGFTAVAVLTLAVAIGVNSAIFSMVNGVLLRPVVPLKPAEVVNVFSARQNASHDYRQFSHAEYAALKERNDTFADLAAIEFSLAGIGRDEGIRRSFVFLTSENFFALLGVKPALGRFYTEDEARPNANLPVVVASYPCWQRLGGRADFVGSTLRVNGRIYTVIGVTPKGFSGLNAMIAPDLWLPLGVHSQIDSAFNDNLTLRDLTQPKSYTLNLVARMTPGLTLDAARNRLPALARRLTALQPSDAPGARELQIESPSRFSISTDPSGDGSVGIMAALLLAMAGVVLLIACLNLANMLLARGTARNKEMAIRLALGASRGIIVRQLLVEGLLLALAGGGLGLLFSIWTNSLMLQSFETLLSTMNFSFVIQLQPDPLVIGVTFAFCLLATLLFSLGPALKASRADVVHDLKQQGADDAPGASRWNRFFSLRHCLVMGQIALSLMLLFAGGLFFRGALKASGLDLGFNPRGGLVTEMDFSLASQPEAAGKRRVFAALERARQLPGVPHAALATLVPFGNIAKRRRVVPASEAPVTRADPNAPEPGANGLFVAITPGYFDAIGVRLLRGRDFTETEAREKDSSHVAIVDELLARKLFPQGEALGQRIRYTQAPSDGSPAEMEIVGIVRSHRHQVFGALPPKRLFVPYAQAYSSNVFLHVKLANDAPAAVAAGLQTLRAELRRLDPDLPVLALRTFADVVEKDITLWVVRLGAVLFGVFGVIALVLAVVGVYGVKAFAVARRTREIGIRMALGADRADVFALIMRQGAAQTGVAIGAGVALSLLVGQALKAMLYQVSPADPLVLGTAIVLLAGAALLACWLPARRATKVNPLTALRTE